VSKIVIFSAANAEAVTNIQHSVIEGVGTDVLLESRMSAALQSHTENGSIRLWGIRPGERGTKRAHWARLDPPAVGFFYTAGAFRYTATIWAKEPPDADGTEGNPALSQTVWGDPGFELIGYLEDVTAVEVATDELKAALGYEPGYALGRESIVPSEPIQNAVIAEFGSAEAFRDAVVGHVGTRPLDELPAAESRVGPLGTTYRREGEKAQAERSDVYRVDPDAIDRGTQAHATTQDLLADHVVSRGLTPKSWNGQEAHYDLAWEAGDTIFIAEVKSLTDQNEERQLRLALGQILRYAHLLSRIKGRPIQKVIVVERQPTRSSEWVELCSTCDVKLVWPETFWDI
jgi:hypothetical protein